MAATDRRYNILRALRPDERLEAARVVLAAGPPEEHESAALLLIELAAAGGTHAPLVSNGRRRDHAAYQESVRALAMYWRRIPAPLRQLALAAGRGRWGAAVGGIDGPALTRHGQSIAELAIDSCDPALAGALAGILETAEGATVGAAAQAILADAVRLTGEDDPAILGVERDALALRPILDPEVSPWSGADFANLLQVVARGVESFETHRRKELLLAALLLLEGPRGAGPSSGPLHRLVGAADSVAGNTLRTAIRRARSPIARRRAWLWLREISVAAACSDRLARAPTVADHAAVLPLAHLALAPARARHLSMIPIATRPTPHADLPPDVEPGGRRLHPEGPVPDRVAVQLLGYVARRQAPRFIASLRSDEATKAIALDPFLADTDPVVRLAAARAAGPRGLRDYCFDGCTPIARHAALGATSAGLAESGRLRAGDAGRRRFAAALARSPHAAVRRVGCEELERLGPGGRRPSCALAARRLLAADPSSFVDWVRDRVRSGEEDAALEAVIACRRIGAVGAIEPLALAIIRDSLGAGPSAHARLTATAVASLGDLRAHRVAGVLEECLQRHPDPRVRANAAEALGRCRRNDPREGVLLERRDDAHHRVRASALRVLLMPWPEPKPGRDAPRVAVESLAGMLIDERPAHRLAGVWVVQRSLSGGMRGLVGRRWDELAGRVRWLADADAELGVRRRALAVVGRLDAAIAGLGPRAAGGLPA